MLKHPVAKGITLPAHNTPSMIKHCSSFKNVIYSPGEHGYPAV